MAGPEGIKLPPSAVDAGPPPEGWATARAMNPLEALMWRMESDPKLRSPVTAVYLLDQAPDWDRLMAALEWGTRIVPRARMHAVEPPLGLAEPVWAVDPRFDLGYHARRVQVPAPGTFEQALEIAQGIAMRPFDRARPPWETVLLEGLEEGRAVWVLKMHHSLTDGLGGVQLGMLLHSRRREHTEGKVMPAPPEPEPLDPMGALADRVEDRLRRAPEELVGGARRAAGIAGALASRPQDAVGGALRLGRSFGRMLAPPPCPPSPLLRGRSLSWRFGALECELDDIKRAGRAGGGTLNDAYSAALLGGLRRYHEEQGKPIDELPMAMPINVRAGDHPMGGNRFAGTRFAAPIGVADPAERVALLRELVLNARSEPALEAMGALAGVLSRVPAPLAARWYGAQSQNIDLQASNVPGSPVPMYIAGARIDRIYPYGPLPGCAVMVALLSHAGTCCIGINVDAAAVTEHELFMDCMREGLDEVLALGSADGAQTATPDGRDPRAVDARL
jgi:WS/DGAT/MGAT family acyltransferase